MEEKYFDINSVPGDGFLIFPLSMSRLSNALVPEKIYEFLEFFLSKLSHKSIDVVFLYTNGLYYNSEEGSYLLRTKMLNQMVNHKSALDSLILGKRDFIPGAFHFLPWDYTILNTPFFNKERTRLVHHSKNDSHFQKALQQDLDVAEMPASEANLNFLLEELVISHLLTEKEIFLPHRLATYDGWRLLCYPGNPPVSLVYLWKKNLLGNRQDFSKQHLLFASSFYNMEARVLINFAKQKVKNARFAPL